MSNFIGSDRLGLTDEWLIEKLSENCPDFKQKLENGLIVEKVEIRKTLIFYFFQIVSTQMTAETGMMSYVHRCDVHFSGQKTVLHYCLKEPDNDRMDDIVGFDFYPILMELQDRECLFYETFLNVPDLKIPKIIDMKRLHDNDKVK